MVRAMSQCHVSGRPVGMDHVPVPRVRPAYRYGPCPSATCQADLSVRAMSQCHVSDRSVGMGHVPVPRVRPACRYGPCLSATCQAGLSVWAMPQYSSPRLISAAEQSSIANATLSSLTLRGLFARGRPVTALCPGAYFDHTSALLH